LRQIPCVRCDTRYLLAGRVMDLVWRPYPKLRWISAKNIHDLESAGRHKRPGVLLQSIGKPNPSRVGNGVVAESGAEGRDRSKAGSEGLNGATGVACSVNLR
jgi:hypothetical protein